MSVIYQIYPARSRTRTATGSATCAGVVSKLDYLAWLGVDAIWLSPTFPSPNVDWGYDVSDYSTCTRSSARSPTSTR